MSIRTLACYILRLLPALVCAAWAAAYVKGAEELRKPYDLPAGDAAVTLRQFADISGSEILYAAEVIRGVRTSAVKGEFTPLEALQHMLVGTSLYAISGEAIALRQNPAAPQPRQPRGSKKPNEPPAVKLRKILPFLAGWLVAGASVNAQSGGAIEGRVLNAVTGDYLGNARLVVDGTNLQVFSNEYGQYHLADVPAGSATLRVFYTGLASGSVAVQVAAGQTLTKDVSLAPSGVTTAKEGEPLQLDPFLVASTKEINASALAINEQRYAPNIKNVLSADEFGGVTEGNIGEFIKFLPGITVNYAGADARSVGVRGMADTATIVTVDGNAVPPSAAGPATRTFGFDQLSINNLSRIELTKGPTPDSSADAIGGTINLVSKSAFERSRPELKYRAFLSMNEHRHRDVNFISFDRTPGPGREPSRKIRPGFDFSYTNPVSKNFGFTLTGSNSNVFNPEDGSNLRWNPSSNASPTLGTVANPVMSAYLPEWGLKMTSRYSLGATADFRIAKRHVVKIGGSWNAFDALLNSTTATINASTPTDWGPTFTQGGNAGSVSWAPFHRHSIRSTYLLNARYQYNGRVWKFEANGYSSHAKGEDRDMDEGYFIQFTYNMTGLRLRFDDINEIRPQSITATTAAGAPVAIRQLADYTLRTVQTAPGIFATTANGAKASLQGIVDVLNHPIQVKVGVDARRVIADSRKTTRSWTFVGPDGRAGTADDRIGNYDLIATSWSSLPAPYGNGLWEILDTYKSYDLYQAHPEYFLHNDVAQIQNAVLNSQVITEDIAAAYIRLDARFLDNRLWVVTGVRYENTRDDGYGPVNDITRTYQRDANGNIVIGANGRPVPVVGDAVALARLRYQDRGARIRKDYGDFYPSLNLSYNITPNLIARAAYSHAISRPNYSFLIPGTTLPDPAGTSRTITVNNPDLKPWTAKNYDLALSYYPGHGGEISAGVFRKDINDFFGAAMIDVTPELAEQYGLDNIYVDSGYVLSYRQNVGKARVTGVEFNYRQPLKFLPHWARGVYVRYNMTRLHLEGDSLADFSSFMPFGQNWGISLDRKKYGVRLNWNYRGRVRRGVLGGTAEPGSYEYLPQRMTMDLDADYYFTKHVGLFFNARNITGEAWMAQRYGPSTPAYARWYRRLNYGTAISVGLKGSF